jgi:hypothetical protein
VPKSSSLHAMSCKGATGAGVDDVLAEDAIGGSACVRILNDRAVLSSPSSELAEAKDRPSVRTEDRSSHVVTAAGSGDSALWLVGKSACSEGIPEGPASTCPWAGNDPCSILVASVAGSAVAKSSTQHTKPRVVTELAYVLAAYRRAALMLTCIYRVLCESFGLSPGPLGH